MNFTDLNGDIWLSDIFSTGMAVDECATTTVLSGVTDRGLYCTYREWNASTTGPLSLPSSIPGYYKVTVYFAETSAMPGERVVDIFILGYRIFTGIDVAMLSTSGTLVLDLTGYSVDGSINIEIVASSGFPTLSAIKREFIPADVAPFAVRVNSGSTASFVDLAGNTWMADNFFTGGSTFSLCPVSIDGTVDDEIFCSERSGNFIYSVPVPGFGFHRVVLHFAEIFCEYSVCIEL